MGKKKRGRGRPPLGAKARTQVVHIRVSKGELRKLRANAKAQGVSMGELLRRGGGLES